jgi:hypothetical protein
MLGLECLDRYVDMGALQGLSHVGMWLAVLLCIGGSLQVQLICVRIWPRVGCW